MHHKVPKRLHCPTISFLSKILWIGRKLLDNVDVSELYDALTSVLLRTVFILYAEDKGLLPMDNPIYNEAYSIGGLGHQLGEN